jgi:hypothetical protein
MNAITIGPMEHSVKMVPMYSRQLQTPLVEKFWGDSGFLPRLKNSAITSVNKSFKTIN